MERIRNYTNLRKYLLEVGFKCVDIDNEGNEVFQINNFKFSIKEKYKELIKKCDKCKAKTKNIFTFNFCDECAVERGLKDKY